MKLNPVLILLILLTSCNAGYHSKFNRQKYTDLKPIQPDEIDHEDESGFVPSSYQFDEDVIDNFQPSDQNSETINQDDISFSDENVEETFIESFSESNQSSEQSIPTKKQIGDPRDFEKLSDEEKQEALIGFNRIFNNGLILFLLGILLALGSFSALFLLGGTAFLVFVVWIMSFVALNKLKRINIYTQEKSTRIKFRLAQVVCGIGVTACIVTVLGGLVLLILWGAKVI